MTNVDNVYRGESAAKVEGVLRTTCIQGLLGTQYPWFGARARWKRMLSRFPMARAVVPREVVY
eukprot:1180825-Prorocentrum_minimum.AAC.3